MNFTLIKPLNQNKMKQTAVEWLENEFQEIFKEWGGLDTNWLKRFEQAKAMEKAEKDKQYQRGFKDGSNHIKIIYNL